MIGVLLTSIVVAGGFTILNSSVVTSAKNEQTVQTQQNARVAMELLTQDLKAAGFGMLGLNPSTVTTTRPAAPGPGTTTDTCNYGIVPSDANPVGNDTGPDSIWVVVPVLLSTLNANVTSGATVLAMQTGSLGVFLSTASPPALPALGNGSVVTIDGHYPSGASNADANSVTLSSAITEKGTFPGCVVPCPPNTTSAPVYWLQCIKYEIKNDATCGGNAPCLVRGGIPVVDGIEDLQLAYACDGCVGVPGSTVPDGVIDDQVGSAAGFDAKDFVSNNAWGTAPMTPDSIRLVRITVVARALHANVAEQQGIARISTPTPLVVEDHNHANGVFVSGDLTGAALQTYQVTPHRQLTRTIRLRNAGLTS
jgi:type IV pilus assembly protein PilW